jgi:hypothetical protein
MPGVGQGAVLRRFACFPTIAALTTKYLLLTDNGELKMNLRNSSFPPKQIISVGMLAIFCCITSNLLSQDYRRWQMNQDGSISWIINNNIPHNDHIEMSGKSISSILRYGVDADGSFQATRSLVWPMLRTIPNNTHASLTRQFALDAFDLVMVNYKPIVAEKVVSITLNGVLLVKSKAGNNIELTREFFPSATLPGYCEIYTIKNTSEKRCLVEIPRRTIFIIPIRLKAQKVVMLYRWRCSTGEISIFRQMIPSASLFFIPELKPMSRHPGWI